MGYGESKEKNDRTHLIQQNINVIWRAGLKRPVAAVIPMDRPTVATFETKRAEYHDF